jgi:hypothetical protein
MQEPASATHKLSGHRVGEPMPMLKAAISQAQINNRRAGL